MKKKKKRKKWKEERKIKKREEKVLRLNGKSGEELYVRVNLDPRTITAWAIDKQSIHKQPWELKTFAIRGLNLLSLGVSKQATYISISVHGRPARGAVDAGVFFFFRLRVVVLRPFLLPPPPRRPPPPPAVLSFCR